ncbi:fumarylacetoacetate hydrolase family protein [Aquabacterium sp. A3]|uniref:fumarylacetoacetate hydrolase family protein n=1 Tax=Aquabacterium sp. A3 TaxID=3132829 RepID=UPI00311966FE
MATPLVRYAAPGNHATAQWGVLFDRRIAPLSGAYATTADVVRHGQVEARALRAAQATVSLDEVSLLSPITTNQQFLCQGINYGSHVRESGIDPASIPFNTFFTKASSSLAGPFDDVVRPAHVQLLDYEIELGLVMGRDLSEAVDVRADRLHEVLAGVTIVNDVSARDVQLPQVQFYKGKSYRSFGPTGPVLLLLEPHEWARWPDLHMRLSVNGQVRQDSLCRDMIHPPHKTISEFSALQNLQAGDLIATGTPAGCAARAPGKLSMWVARHFLSESTKWRLFIKGGRRNPLYLQPNDVMTLSIRTDDGALDLGQQRNKVTTA